MLGGGCSFTALVAESYNRAYMAMLTVQQLAEMEEIIAFRRQVRARCKGVVLLLVVPTH